MMIGRMDNQKVLRARSYLSRYDKILQEMENKMKSFEPENNITKYFIECMIPHHQSAIYMSKSLLEYTTYEELQKMARRMIEVQTEEIEELCEIYRTTIGYINTKEDTQKYNNKYLLITTNMINKMKMSCRTININLNFATEMIPHHEGAIEMCNNLLKYCIDPRLKRIAQKMIKEQNEQIQRLKQIIHLIK